MSMSNNQPAQALSDLEKQAQAASTLTQYEQAQAMKAQKPFVEPIHQIKFVTHIPIGPTSDLEGWLEQGVVKSGYKLQLTAVAEGVRIVGTNIDRKYESYQQLIPMHQVQSFLGKLVRTAPVVDKK